MTERYAKSARQHITSIQPRWVGNVEPMCEAHFDTDVRVLFAREIFIRYLAVAKLLKVLVARDGIEPPTPAFSGPRSTN